MRDLTIGGETLRNEVFSFQNCNQRTPEFHFQSPHYSVQPNKRSRLFGGASSFMLWKERARRSQRAPNKMKQYPNMLRLWVAGAIWGSWKQSSGIQAGTTTLDAMFSPRREDLWCGGVPVYVSVCKMQQKTVHTQSKKLANGARKGWVMTNQRHLYKTLWTTEHPVCP